MDARAPRHGPAVRVPLFDMAAELAPIRAEVDAAIARVLEAAS